MRIHPTLPIYLLDSENVTVLYTPGTLAVVEPADGDLIRRIWAGKANSADHPHLVELTTWITDHARSAEKARREWLDSAFAPECLTVYLSNRCNLKCRYCYADAGGSRGRELGASPVLEEGPFTAAAGLVARHCADKQIPFQLVLHGGGEPTLHGELLKRFVEISRSAADQAGVQWRGYIATNGVMPPDLAVWLGRHFQRIGISCDGPPNIQNRQRPMRSGGATAHQVAQTARIVREFGADIEVRATITPDTRHRQEEILQYLATTLGADRIRFEPVYRLPGSRGDRFPPTHAETFADAFMKARRAAAHLGVDLAFSGIRLDTHHGPYCNILRQVLHLTPDGRAAACFFCVDGRNPAFQNRIIGEWDPNTERFRLDDPRIARLRTRAARIPSECRDCFAAYHCNRGCPEICRIETVKGAASLKDLFRCRLNRAVGRRLIAAAAENLIQEQTDAPVSVSAPDLPDDMQTAMKASPPDIQESVIRQYRAVAGVYALDDRGLPAPIWRERGFTHSPEAAWRELVRIIGHGPADPISVYVHIPFCNRRCGFCDCYALKTSPNHPLQTAYTERLIQDIRHWSALRPLSGRPVTTVHFGGGTPNCLPPARFQAIVSELSDRFSVGQETEWAMESTASLLTDEDLNRLKGLGFTRLHIGVQTLEPQLRRRIGRRASARRVLETIGRCLAAGFVTSVDLVYGLPGETADGFLNGLDRLIQVGVHGVSLYRFNRSGRNRRFVRRFGMNHSSLGADVILFLAADQVLVRAGYRKNHFTHYALPADRNRYYTHARRGEDLLGLGASADGVFQGFHYRYSNISKAFFRPDAKHPPLAGGLMETARERRVSRIVARLMTGTIDAHDIPFPAGLSLMDHWRRHALIEPDDRHPGRFILTGAGSWFIRAMIRELRDSIAEIEEPVDLF